jgi:hypothetical protein
MPRWSKGFLGGRAEPDPPRGASPNPFCLAGTIPRQAKGRVCEGMRSARPRRCVGRMPRPFACESYRAGSSDGVEQEAVARGGMPRSSQGFPWRSCRARPSEGPTPSVWPCGKSNGDVGWPEYRLRRDALRASVKMCWSNAEAHLCGRAKGGGQRGKCHGRAEGFPWRSCRARPSEGRQPKPILPSGDNSETSQRPTLRRDALRASAKMCWSHAEPVRLRIVPGRALRYG